MKSDSYNRGNELCAKSSAKLSYTTSSAESSFNTTSIFKNLAKLTNTNYRSAIRRKEKNPFDDLERRVLFKMRPNYSFEDFKEIQKALLRMPLLDKVQWLKNTDDALNER